MKQINVSYAKADCYFYEAMRVNKGASSEWSDMKEGNALIDTAKTHMNYELIPHHPALDPSNYRKHNRGQGIAEYHKSVTGRAARMKGDEKQLSKAVCCIITMPKDYIKSKFELTEEEYQALEKHFESQSHNNPVSYEYNSAIKKIANVEFDENDQKIIRQFFDSALKAWQRNAGIRDEDMLYAVVHLDESWPHLHIMALPTVEKDILNKQTGEYERKITYSTDKFNNHKTHYFDNLHRNVIALMAADGIDASGLLNGTTEGKGFKPGDFDKSQRQVGVLQARQNMCLEEYREKLYSDIAESEHTMQEAMIEQEKVLAMTEHYQNNVDSLEGEIRFLEHYKSEMKEDLTEAEKEIYEKAESLRLVAESVKRQQEMVDNMNQNIDLIVEERTRKRLAELIKAKIMQILEFLKQFIYEHFRGIHQQHMYDAIEKLELPPDFEVDGKNYGGKTIARAMREAETLDIKEALRDKGIAYSDIEAEDVIKVRSALDKGDNIDEIAAKVADDIIRDSSDR